MPRSDLTPQRQDVPDDPIKLPDGWRACRSCGIAVQAHEDSDSELLIHLSSAGRAAEGPGALTQAVQQQQQIQLTFSLCPSCRRTAELAERLIPPPANAIAVHQLTCALDGLHFLAPTSIENVTDRLTSRLRILRGWSGPSPIWARSPDGVADSSG